VFSREAKQGKMRGVTRSDDEIGLRKTSALRQRGANAANDAPLACDRNAMNVTLLTPLHRLGEA
jgi:hypothetical protein